jgi:hypothetical protein
LTPAILHAIKLVFERLNLEDDVAEHLDETAIAVEREAAVAVRRFNPSTAASFRPRLRWCPSSRHQVYAGTDGDQQRLSVDPSAAPAAFSASSRLDDLTVDGGRNLLLFL